MSAAAPTAAAPAVSREYLAATRHPWACALFVLPLLVAYEVGVLTLGPADGAGLRNGADAWLRWLLDRAGLGQSVLPGAVLGAWLLGAAWWQRADRPADLHNVWIGMVTESALFAVALWGLSRALGPLMEQFGVPLAAPAVHPEPAVQQLIAYLGAGLYEEALFRLVLFSLLWKLFALGDLPPHGALALAVLVSSLLFGVAHHIGPAGEPFQGYVFLFRTLAGVYFALLYRLRGFGVAVGAHAGYDVLVGVIVPSV